MALQRTRRPRLRSGRSLRSLDSPLNARSLGGRAIESRSFALAVAVGLALLTSGCTNVLHIGPTTAKVHLQGLELERYTVHVNLEEGGTFRPDTAGRVEAQIPRFGRTCSRYFLFIPIDDQRPDRLPVIRIAAGPRVVRELSLHEVAGLKTDSEGYHFVNVR
jgi:hypothetical protein